jgi:hypothetical protein
VARPEPPRHHRSPGIGLLVVTTTVLTACVVGFFFQLAETVASIAFSAKPNTQFDTGLFEQDRSLQNAGTLLGHNALVFGGFLLCGLLLAGWRLPLLTVLGRRSVVLIILVFTGYCFWRVAAQNASVAAQISAPRAFFLLSLPHGPLEFGAFFSPLLAAVWPRFRSRRERVAQVGRAILPAFVLLVVAACVECWISPVLLSIPIR